MEEVSLDSMGCSTLTSARPSDHYGFFQTGDGRIFEGTNVDNHFNQVIIYLLKFVKNLTFICFAKIFVEIFPPFLFTLGFSIDFNQAIHSNMSFKKTLNSEPSRNISSIRILVEDYDKINNEVEQAQQGLDQDNTDENEPNENQNNIKDDQI